MSEHHTVTIVVTCDGCDTCFARVTARLIARDAAREMLLRAMDKAGWDIDNGPLCPNCVEEGNDPTGVEYDRGPDYDQHENPALVVPPDNTVNVSMAVATRRPARTRDQEGR